MGCRSAELSARSLPASYDRSGCAVERTVDYVHLLLASQPHEIHGVPGNPDGEGWIFFWMLHRIKQHCAIQNVHVHMITRRSEKCVQHAHEIVDLIFRCPTETLRHHGSR